MDRELPMPEQVILVDAGTGNLRSVYKALESLGAGVTLTSDPRLVSRGGHVILPGVGSFGDFMAGLRARGLEESILNVVKHGFPLLGICVGMQALFEVGEEMGEHKGLGLLPGRVERFPDIAELKIPHTGWNQLWLQTHSLLWRGLRPGDYAYFNHSYYCVPGDPRNAIANTDYGIQFASAVQNNNLFGVQFHPEKSQRVGLQILANFLHE
jgi:glutamine amidotransferase